MELNFKKFLLLAITVICLLLSSCVTWDKMNHLAAKEYLQEQGYEIDTGFYTGFRSVIITKDSTILWVNSSEVRYPFIKEVKIIRSYKVEKPKKPE